MDSIIALIVAYASLNGLDPNLLLSIAKVESGFNPNAVSYAGAVGLFQIMPQYSNYSVDQLKDPEINIKEAVRILKEYKKTCVHQEGLNYLVCFNFGPANAKKVKHPELFPYVKKVSAVYNEYSKRN